MNETLRGVVNKELQTVEFYGLDHYRKVHALAQSADLAAYGANAQFASIRLIDLGTFVANAVLGGYRLEIR